MKGVQINNNQMEISIIEACKKGIFVTLPTSILLFLVYYLIRGEFGNMLKSPWTVYFIIMLMFAVLFAFHEIIHAIFYLYYTKWDYKKIKIGSDEEYLKIYCKCMNFISLKQKMIVTVMPLIICGFIPYIISVIFTNFNLMVASLMIIIFCATDIFKIFVFYKNKQIKQIKDIQNSYGYMRYEIKK